MFAPNYEVFEFNGDPENELTDYDWEDFGSGKRGYENTKGEAYVELISRPVMVLPGERTIWNKFASFLEERGQLDFVLRGNPDIVYDREEDYLIALSSKAQNRARELPSTQKIEGSDIKRKQ